jgi:hypothetical protein
MVECWFLDGGFSALKKVTFFRFIFEGFPFWEWRLMGLRLVDADH